MAVAKERQQSGFRIFYQILLAMTLVAAIPLTGLWYISLYQARQEWTDTIQQKLQDTTTVLAREVDAWTEMNLRLLQQNAATPALLSMEESRQNGILKTIADKYPWVYLAFTVLPNGENLGRSDGKAKNYYGDRDYFKQVLGGRDVGQQVLLGKTSGKPAFILAKPIKGDGPRIGGVIAIAMTLEDLSSTIVRTRMGKTGYAILLDEQNRLMAHGHGEVSSKLQDFGDHPVLQSRGQLRRDAFVFDDGGKKIIGFSKKTSQGWTLIVQQDYAEAFAVAERAYQNGMLLLGVTGIAVICIGYLLAWRLSSPLRRLTTIADSISRGELEVQIEGTNRGDEIGELARAIERMGISLKMAFERLRRR